jgi:hypothetical protein
MRCEALLAVVEAGFIGACGVLESKPLLEGAVAAFCGRMRSRGVGELVKKS